MRKPALRIVAVGLFVTISAAVGNAAADVCLVVDDAHDTFSQADRAAALLLLTKEFEAAGERPVAPPCPEQYAVSHIRLGETIAVRLSGPKGTRDAIARGLDDVPPVYNQMVRSILTGRPMSLRGVIDRTNVSDTQAAKSRVGSDAVFYTRLGYGAIFGERGHGAPSIGIIGYRHELDSFAIDVSFLNFHVGGSPDYGYYDASSSSAFSGSWLKLEGLHFTRPLSNASAYFGGGMSWGGTTLTGGGHSWSGSGLQGELTVGYEAARASTLRVFVQADAGLPFYKAVSRTYGRSGLVSVDAQYPASLTVSVGMGWQRGGRKRP